jgi:4a-hydroxytetrahydrobiopterin dehydratase
MKLHEKKCVPCDGGMLPMNPSEIEDNITKISGWAFFENSITKSYELSDFKHALSFVNKIGEIAENEDHHPDIFLFSYKNVKVILSTHAVGGLSVNDFILAAKIDEIEIA